MVTNSPVVAEQEDHEARCYGADHSLGDKALKHKDKTRKMVLF